MKKAFVFALVIVSLFLACGCSKNTPAATGGSLFVLANFQLSGTTGIVTCNLQNDTTSTDINDATVTVNGQTIASAGSGSYMNLSLTGTFATGDTVTFQAVTSLGTATASGTIPASGGSANSVAVSGAKLGSVFNISH